VKVMVVFWFHNDSIVDFGFVFIFSFIQMRGRDVFLSGFFDRPARASRKMGLREKLPYPSSKYHFIFIETQVPSLKKWFPIKGNHLSSEGKA
jgi:hypothetical protein